MKLLVNRGNVFAFIVGFLYFAVGDVGRLLSLFGLPREIAYGLFFVLFSLFALKKIKKLRFYDVIIIIALLVSVLYGTMKYGQYISTLTNQLAPLLIFFPSYIFFRLYDFEKLENIFEKSAIFSGISLLIYYALVVRHSDATYSMPYAYWVSFPIVCFTGLFLRNRKIIYLIADLLLLFTLFFAGCRGALLLTTLCIIYLILTELFKQGASLQKVIIMVLIVIFGFSIVYFSDNILSYLSQFSGTSRNIRMLLNGGMLESASRDMLHTWSQHLIDQNTWGYGPLASRQLLLGHNYPHSLWYELQLDYGQIPGISIFVAIMSMVVLNLIRYRNKSEKIIVAFISIIGVGSLMVSSSYFYEIYVPATIAMFINWNVFYKNKVVNK